MSEQQNSPVATQTLAAGGRARRNSSIELLRIISIALILSMHTLGPYWGTENFLNKEWIIFINAIGNAGVSIFVLISGFYGIHFKSHKFFGLVNLVLFYSVFQLFFQVFSGEPFVLRKVIYSFIPVLSDKYWFATSYILLYSLSGFINEGLASLSKPRFLQLLSVLLLFFVVAPTFFQVEILDDGGKGPVNMFLTYCVGRYLGTYGFPSTIRRSAFKWLLGSVFTAMLAHTFLVIMSGHFFIPLSRDNSLLTLIISVSVLHIFLKWNFYNSSINQLSSYVFAIYLLHHLFLKYWFINVNSNGLIPYLFLKVSALILVSVLIDQARALLFRGSWDRLIALQCKVLDKMTPGAGQHAGK